MSPTVALYSTASMSISCFSSTINGLLTRPTINRSTYRDLNDKYYAHIFTMGFYMISARAHFLYSVRLSESPELFSGTTFLARKQAHGTEPVWLFLPQKTVIRNGGGTPVRRLRNYEN